jgi:hypothetical protein
MVVHICVIFQSLYTDFPSYKFVNHLLHFRLGVEPKLLGDIENLKTFALMVGDSLPIDYYKVREDGYLDVACVLFHLYIKCQY